MPLFDYKCQSCEHVFEALVRGTETPVCEECGSEDLERLTSLPTVHSEGTHDKALRSARKRDAGMATDRMHERLKYEESHDRHG